MKALWFISPVAAEVAVAGTSPEDGLLLCPLASVRLRIGVAAAAWKRSGHQNAYAIPGTGIAFGAGGAPGICYVGKFFGGMDAELWLQACSDAQRQGARLVVDVCDFPFFDTAPSVQQFYRAVFAMCDAVIVNSRKMAELIAPHSPRPAVVIEDAIIGTRAAAAFSPGERLELLWFGHSRNLPFLPPCIAPVADLARQQHVRLTIVSDELQGVAEGMTRSIQAQFAPALETRYIRWSLESMKRALRNCDLVLLPGDPAHPMKSGASANRIAEALHGGRLPLANPLDSYLPFAQSAWIGPVIVEGIRWALANRGEALARIRDGQALVTEKFGPDRIGRQWRELFAGLA